MSNDKITITISKKIYDEAKSLWEQLKKDSVKMSSGLPNIIESETVDIFIERLAENEIRSLKVLNRVNTKIFDNFFKDGKLEINKEELKKELGVGDNELDMLEEMFGPVFGNSKPNKENKKNKEDNSEFKN
ncbi:hypothetical protein MGM1_4840 [Candidatus Malacoplasma girerdii]|uniref:Uncharacterized protein n=1 Tax=Candidatus Malacoplasma girerdii TaxID=1318617 RepID=A0A097STD5_9BACT|nr:hypothetical protein MGM1_4840 [Candidatus Malacoplasma girerdii]ASJ89364.1 MAG: hypothetical protein B1217_0483 [Candidatus Malacoplasma girerdii]